MVLAAVAWIAATAIAARELIVPDHQLTPGLARLYSAAEVCGVSWGHDRRHVSAAMKRRVFAAYGLAGNGDPACVRDRKGRRCEIDHLISRELGGADDVRNLWPQPYGSRPWNAVRKDQVENRLHREVCAGAITLEAAQREIAADWRVPYRRYFGEP
jgi:hypothetical protein